MSPEQLAGDKLDGCSDIYSLGLVAFNMLTGKLPFPSESAQESMIMRLTDKPKPLAEMKADRSWPADVQAVMDKALERDANARYQSATEFGMALYNAIQRMPETAAAEAGTAVLSAVPATRVAAAPASAAATVAVPTPPVSSPSVAQDTAPEKKKSNMPIMVGAAAVLVIGAIGAKMMMSPKPSSAPADSVTQQSTPAPTASTPTPTTTPVDQMTKKVEAPRTLAQLETDAETQTKGAAVLSALSSWKPANDDEKARVNYIRFKVYSAQSDADNACIAIKEAIKVVVDPVAKSKYETRAAGC
jgi:hypothetical protein